MARVKCSANMGAFLDMISFSEGTNIEGSDDGYDVLVGKTLFEGYAKHPKQKVWIERINDYSTAAGRYQTLGRIADFYTKRLWLPDFGPESQDRIALQLIKECRAYGPIESGEIHKAIRLCSSRWASLPGNDYGQRKETFSNLIYSYAKAGGKLCPASTALYNFEGLE